jgi:hypothetical protein
VVVRVEDKLEKELPSLGLLDVIDAETGEPFTIDTNSKGFKELYKKEMLKDSDELKRVFRKAQVDEILIEEDENYVDPLIEFFRARRSK